MFMASYCRLFLSDPKCPKAIPSLLCRPLLTESMRLLTKIPPHFFPSAAKNKKWRYSYQGHRHFTVGKYQFSLTPAPVSAQKPLPHHCRWLPGHTSRPAAAARCSAS